jgi:hypothetical protein
MRVTSLASVRSMLSPSRSWSVLDPRRIERGLPVRLAPCQNSSSRLSRFHAVTSQRQGTAGPPTS